MHTHELRKSKHTREGDTYVYTCTVILKGSEDDCYEYMNKDLPKESNS